jgi:hypothetical protein
MEYQKPLLTATSLEIGVACCTPDNPYCNYTPPSCRIGALTVYNYTCSNSNDVPGVDGCVYTASLRVANIGIGGANCF